MNINRLTLNQTNMTNLIEVQIADPLASETPSLHDIQLWCDTVLKHQNVSGEVAVRIVDEAEMIELNQHYRQKQGPTNVLSFPSDIPDLIKETCPLLGDIIICAPVVDREAKAQSKPNKAHWAHMVIHGTLHLLGFDHMTPEQAEPMERLEIEILHTFGFNNPYEVN